MTMILVPSISIDDIVSVTVIAGARSEVVFRSGDKIIKSRIS